MKKLLVVGGWLLVLAAVCSGCLSNHYENYYADMDRKYAGTKGIEKEQVELRPVTTEDDVLNLIESGYVAIGKSAFTARYTPLYLAVETAQEHGADLVLYDIRFKETKQYTSVMYLPSTTTSYTYGNANVYSHGHTAYGTYSGTTTSTTMEAVPVQREVDIYDHDTMFFKKIDCSNQYGVRFYLPDRLPGESVDVPIVVHVLAVVKGSKAERDGIKRGGIVKKINGIEIIDRKSITPFLDFNAAIESMEVSYEK